MSQAMTVAPQTSIMEDVLIRGDLLKLSAEERAIYYMEVCKSVGLNPLTKPFEYINLNGKLVLYATRACTDQLRTIHVVSVVDMVESDRDGVFIVTVKVQNKDGHTDMAKGAVTITNLKGEALANAFMKAETKAKRRATLSICGLGFLDETEIETIPPSAIRKVPEPIRVGPPHDPATGEIMPHIIMVPDNPAGEGKNWIAWGGSYIAALKHTQTLEELEAWILLNSDSLARCHAKAQKAAGSVEKAIFAMRDRLKPVIVARMMDNYDAGMAAERREKEQEPLDDEPDFIPAGDVEHA